jgi:hypothetical protein
MRYPFLVVDALRVLAAHGVVAEVEQSSHLKIKFTNSFGPNAC